MIINRSTQFKFFISTFLTLAVCSAESPIRAEDDGLQMYTLPALTVQGQETANLRPATTFESPVSNLDFDPRIDFQSRNMAEAQGDVSIRGGIFEGTGIQLGSVTLIDPQTGHYSTELPVAPEMLGELEVYTGADNALYGFNSSTGTVHYDWSQILKGGSLTVGAGAHALNFQRLHQAWAEPLGKFEEGSLAYELEYSQSESDGSVQFGDHDFDRTTARIQFLRQNAQTDLFAGYQSKYFGWPAMYTANKFIDPIEYENIKTRLFILNHQHDFGGDDRIEFSLSHRRNSDHYQLDAISRSSGNAFSYSAKHETEVASIGFNGFYQLNAGTGIHYSGQLSRDELESTSLTDTSRSYSKLSLLPEHILKEKGGERLSFRWGMSLDNLMRDDAEASLITDIKWQRSHANGDSESSYLSFSESSQVAGYTAVSAANAGPFASNADLLREISQNLEIGTSIVRDSYKFEGALFYRWDTDLVDWTHTTGDPYARTATGVDLETWGLELIASKRWKTLEALASYTALDKSADYGDSEIEASFYALNYAKHRLTFGAIWSPNDSLVLRVDNEWRIQEDNPLRTSSKRAFFSHFGLSFYPPQYSGLELFVSIDNAWDEDFQDMPGTPGRGVQSALGISYSW